MLEILVIVFLVVTAFGLLLYPPYLRAYSAMSPKERQAADEADRHDNQIW